MNRTPSRCWVVSGGDVLSRNDGQRHYVSAGRVARLHQLADHQWQRWSGVNGDYPPGTVILHPRADGVYRDLSGEKPPQAQAQFKRGQERNY